MKGRYYLGIDCGSVSLNLALMDYEGNLLASEYVRTNGKPLATFLSAAEGLIGVLPSNGRLGGAMVTGSGRELLSRELQIPATNEIRAHGTGAHWANNEIRTIIEIGGQDSKFIQIEPFAEGAEPRISFFRMNEICAAGTGAFLDEQASRLGVPVEEFGALALQSANPAPIAGRCAVFAKSDMIHRAQEGANLPDILMGASYSLARNFMANLIRGARLKPLISLQGGVMANEAVVKAFHDLLEDRSFDMIIPPHFNTLGAIGCGLISTRDTRASEINLPTLMERARKSSGKRTGSSGMAPLPNPSMRTPDTSTTCIGSIDPEPPFIMGLDIGSVSAKGVILDRNKRIVRTDYRLTDGKPLDAVSQTIRAISHGLEGLWSVAVTGSGRSLAGALLKADTIVNEISAQARAALEYDPTVECIVEIGGQDSKWISIRDRAISDFVMNRVCAAGTGSFLMEQSSRLGLEMGPEFSAEAFSSEAPSDLGSRCAVFMESDLVHHRNNGADRSDLAAGVCLSIVKNYLERVASGKAVSGKVMFLGGVAANDAVRAAFESHVGSKFHSPWFYKVSAAYGAALKGLDMIEADAAAYSKTHAPSLDPEALVRESFRCSGCNNRCMVDKYLTDDDRIIFHGGLCDKWEHEQRAKKGSGTGEDPFLVRARRLESAMELSREVEANKTWGMVRSPVFYDWFPFWRSFLGELGIALRAPDTFHREQYESGLHRLRVETCLPMKALAGQLEELVAGGVKDIFHPSVISETKEVMNWRPLEQCPYTQASSEFLKGPSDLNWHEPVICHEPHGSRAFREDHIEWALGLGFSRSAVERAYKKAAEVQREFERELDSAGEAILGIMEDSDPLIVVMGKTYHISEPFFNMNLASIFRRLGVAAIPGDLLPISGLPSRSPLPWKNQLRLLAEARAVGERPNMFPILISFFGCGPDPFTVRHIQSAVKDKPLLILEMDEHSSKAGIMTRIEAFMDRLAQRGKSPLSKAPGTAQKNKPRSQISAMGLDTVYIPYFGEHAHILAATARSMGISAEVLPQPDEESAELGRAHLTGGECHPFALMLGDFLKLNKSLKEERAAKSMYAIPGFSACRLGQYPIYTEKIRKDLGIPMRVITDLSQSARSSGLPPSVRDMILMRMWEGLNAFDLLLAAYYSIRPRIRDHWAAEQAYSQARDSIVINLAMGRTSQGVKEAMAKLASLELDPEPGNQPIIAVTGDYYTRIVPFANNGVFEEIESLGGVVLPPPTFTDGVRYYYMKQALASGLQGASQDDASTFYPSAVLAQRKILSAAREHFPVNGLDPFSVKTLRKVAQYYDARFPAGIAAPVATLLGQLDQGIHGVLNLITLNCSYGTVVTATLSRALAERGDTPMLTLVYDGLKKTNERTRLEAFMDQAKDRMNRRGARATEDSLSK